MIECTIIAYKLGEIDARIGTYNNPYWQDSPEHDSYMRGYQSIVELLSQ